MSLEFMDGFDHYNGAATIQRKWDAASSNTAYSTGRFGGNAMNAQNGIYYKTLTSVATRVIGFAYQSTWGISSFILASFYDGATTQVDVRLTASGALQVTRNGTVLGTSATGLIVINAWNYIEFKATINSTTGSFDVHIAGSSVVSGSGVNTQNTANATSSVVVIGGSYPNSPAFNYDDLYVLNSSGSVNNTFLGESKIVTNLPNADSGSAGTNTLWTPSAAGTHFSKVNDTPNPDDDSTYVSSQTAGQLDTYKYPAATLIGTISGVQIVLCERKDNTGSRTTAVEYRSSGGTNYAGANNFSPGSNYLMDRQIFETDPATSAAWTQTGINGGEFGVNLVA